MTSSVRDPAKTPTPLKGSRKGEIRAEVTDQIDAVDPDAWDAILDPDDLQATHRFVRVCQESEVERASYRLVLLQDGRGPLAVAALSAFRVRLDLLSPAWVRKASAVIRRGVKGFSETNLVVCGLPVSFNQSCLRIRPGVDPHPIMEIIASNADEMARNVEASIVCFKEHEESEMSVAGPLKGMGYGAAVSLPSCLLNLPFRSWSEYQEAMRAGYRRQLRTTLRSAEDAGLHVRTERLGPLVPIIFPLYEEVMERTPYRLETLNEAFFSKLAKRLPETSVLLVEAASGELLCAAILLRGPTRTTFLISGIDYEKSVPVRGYETLVSEVVRQAIRWGSTSLELGQTSWELKLRLGARLTPRYLFLRHRNGLANRALRASLPLLFPERRFGSRRVFRGRVGSDP